VALINPMMMESSYQKQHHIPQTESFQKLENQKLTTKRRRRSAGVGLFLTKYDSNVDLLEDEEKLTSTRFKSKRLQNRAQNIKLNDSASTVKVSLLNFLSDSKGADGFFGDKLNPTSLVFVSNSLRKTRHKMTSMAFIILRKRTLRLYEKPLMC
jgi:hypothetical protein